MGLTKFVVKLGLASGAVYYVNKEGVWKNSEESMKVCDNLKLALEPHLQVVKDQIPFEMPDLPANDQTVYLAGKYWNDGVGAAFEFLKNLPQHCNKWASNGYDKVMDNEEMKKFIDSFQTSNAEKAK